MFRLIRCALGLAPLFLAANACQGAQAAAVRAAAAPSNFEPLTYRIGPGDVLQVDVWKEPDASSPAATVRPDGRITLPMLGEVQAAGLMPSELQKSLVGKYGELIKDASVIVTVREINSQKVYLIGEVRREGPVKLVAPLTVLQALAEAGGITDYAKRKRIYILRTAGGRQAILPFDYDAVVRGEKVQQNVVLLPGDTIVVPR
jgi:polysaccharide export outer membrane protein